MRNYYKILGLKFGVSDEEVKRAYRELAKQCHPDLNGDAASAEKFADISEAYETLGDPALRAEYDKKVQEKMAAKRAATAQNQSFAQAYAQTMNNGYDQAYRMAADAQKSAYNKGYAQGFTDAKGQAEQNAAAWRRENESLRARLREAEERENASAERLRQTEAAADRRAAELTKTAPVKENDKQMRSRIEKLTGELSAAGERIDRLTAERKYYEERYGEAKTRLNTLEEELETTRRQLATWEEYGKTLDAAEDIERTEVEWERLKRDYKKRSKPTLYGTLGVMFYAQAEEIRDAYIKLANRFKKKADSDKNYEEKLFAVNDAYKTLSDPDLKAAYDLSQGIDEAEREEAADKQREYEERLKTLYAEKEEQDFRVYLEELMFSAQTGEADAQNTLGEMYYYGDEIEKDPGQAVYWFKESAKQRNPDALYNLGRCFLSGEGVAADENAGKGFIKQAAALGSEAAREFMKGSI